MHAHAPRRSAEEQVRLNTALTALAETQIRFNQVLGLEMVELLGPQGTVCQFAMRPELVGHYLYGRLHGGVTAAVLDATAGLAVMVAIAEKFHHETADQIMHRFAKLGTIDMRVDFLRPGIGHVFTAQAEVTRLGGRVASTQMRLSNESGTLLATGAAAYMVS